MSFSDYCQSIINNLKTAFPYAIESVTEEEIPNIRIAAKQVLNILTFLHNEASFHFLADLTAVHYPEQNALCVVYHIYHIRKNVRLRLQAFVPIDNPCIDSVCSLFACANWMERETYDFFGIIFEGHPNLRRILNADEMDYFPLRKEYALEEQTRQDKDDAMFGR